MDGNTLQQKTLEELEHRLDELPLLPAVIARLLAMSPDDPDYFDQVLELAGADPTLSMRIIRLSNSATNAPVREITTLQEAVVRIGSREIAGLITALALMRIFTPTTQGQNNLWIHSVEVAATSRAIARLEPDLGVDPEQAYLCGLLHDIGRFVLFGDSPEEIGRIDESDWHTPAQLIWKEREISGFDHAELGWHACRKWDMPEQVTRVVQHHHVYSNLEDVVPGRMLYNLVQVVQMADFFSIHAIRNTNLTSLSPDVLVESLSANCIHPLWVNPPTSAERLAGKVSRILDETALIIDGLGLTSYK
jgi:putative nucleotidyltransferase with HDIG domain